MLLAQDMVLYNIRSKVQSIYIAPETVQMVSDRAAAAGGVSSGGFCQQMTEESATNCPQAFPEGWASSASTGGWRPRRPSRASTARSHPAPPSPSPSNLPTTRARRPARPCCRSCTSRPIEGTQDPSHSRHSASGKRGTPLELKATDNTARDLCFIRQALPVASR